MYKRLLADIAYVLTNTLLMYPLFIFILISIPRFAHQVYARDMDAGANSELNYSIKGNKGGKGVFKIHSKTGMIATKSALTSGDTYDILVSIFLPVEWGLLPFVISMLCLISESWLN